MPKNLGIEIYHGHIPQGLGIVLKMGDFWEWNGAMFTNNDTKTIGGNWGYLGKCRILFTLNYYYFLLLYFIITKSTCTLSNSFLFHFIFIFAYHFILEPCKKKSECYIYVMKHKNFKTLNLTFKLRFWTRNPIASAFGLLPGPIALPIPMFLLEISGHYI